MIRLAVDYTNLISVMSKMRKAFMPQSGTGSQTNEHILFLELNKLIEKQIKNQLHKREEIYEEDGESVQVEPYQSSIL